MSSHPLEDLIQTLSRLPGLGPRSARRAVLYMIKHRETIMPNLITHLSTAMEKLNICSVCGNVDTLDPCHVCQDTKRDNSLICVVENISDLWALERTGSFMGKYHVLGGTLSALDGIGPDDLKIQSLVTRAQNDNVKEVILAMNATLDGQTTAHYIQDQLLTRASLKVSRLAHGVPIGGELDYLDEGTLSAAMNARRILSASA